MNKRYSLVILLVGLLSFTMFTTAVSDSEKAIFSDAKITVTVVDVDGDPVIDALVTASYTPTTDREEDVAFTVRETTNVYGVASIVIDQVLEESVVTVSAQKTGFGSDETTVTISEASGNSATLTLEQSKAGKVLYGSVEYFDSPVGYVLLGGLVLVLVVGMMKGKKK